MKYKRVKYVCWDVSCNNELSLRMRCDYFKDNDALIYVLDSYDRELLLESLKDLEILMSEPLLKNCSFLLFANKQDLYGALSTEEIGRILQLSIIGQERRWKLQGCSAKTKEGLFEGFSWLDKELEKQNSTKG
eukprot:TRINITY_DN204727_c0_g1_i1.p1 TRINITY_DN204727_c0_g1~~TRINITY_DN204727_c0_g1_i1.p1  ORF type:complete len:133 (-),score=16.34 TRINITY_DN204727_c0_g1_i1:218-616(-)